MMNCGRSLRNQTDFSIASFFLFDSIGICDDNISIRLRQRHNRLLSLFAPDLWRRFDQQKSG
jgi:hypothetical protein